MYLTIKPFSVNKMRSFSLNLILSFLSDIILDAFSASVKNNRLKTIFFVCVMLFQKKELYNCQPTAPCTKEDF